MTKSLLRMPHKHMHIRRCGRIKPLEATLQKRVLDVFLRGRTRPFLCARPDRVRDFCAFRSPSTGLAQAQVRTVRAAKGSCPPLSRSMLTGPAGFCVCIMYKYGVTVPMMSGEREWDRLTGPNVLLSSEWKGSSPGQIRGRCSVYRLMISVKKMNESRGRAYEPSTHAWPSGMCTSVSG